jgi:hypothetical protein
MASFDPDAILAMDLDLDGVKLKPIKAYHLPADRLSIYAGVVDALTLDSTTIAVAVCETEAGVVTKPTTLICISLTFSYSESREQWALLS